jgi:amidase
MSDEFRWWSALETAAAVRSGAVGPNDVVEAAIERVQRIDPSLHWVGTTALRDADHRSTRTTPFAAQLEDLGLRIVGKSACPELSADSTTEPRGFEPTRNPWDGDRTVGGSSGGAAAAVAAGLVPIAHGSDGTGSLRFPASHCGVATLKPSRGRITSIAAAGQSDPRSVWTQFALARDVRDLQALFTLVATPPVSPLGFRSRLRVGLLDHDPIIGLSVAPACARAVHHVGQALAMLGHDVDLNHPPALDGVFGRFWDVWKILGPAIRSEQLAWVTSRLGRPCTDGDVSDAVLELAARGSLLSIAEVDDAWTSVMATMAAVLPWWGSFDVLVTPVTLEPAWLIGDSAPAKTGMFCAPFSFTGQPALVVPSTPSDEGLPIGVQLVGRPGHDELLLEIGIQLQQATAWTDRRPGLVDRG